MWAFTPTGLAQGAQTITASETNAAGLTGSSSLTFTYDTVAPTVTEALAHDTGANNVTSNDALTGTADANATVTLTEGSTVLGSTTANGSGRVGLHPDRPGPGRADRDRQRDQCRWATGSSSLTFTYDTVAPTVTAALAHSHRRQQRHLERCAHRDGGRQCDRDVERRLDRARHHHRQSLAASGPSPRPASPRVRRP